MSIGVGRTLTVLNYVPGTHDPPYLQSASDAALAFFYRGAWSEYPPGSAVSTEAGREALREFLATGELPGSLRWTEAVRRQLNKLAQQSDDAIEGLVKALQSAANAYYIADESASASLGPVR